MVIDSTLSRRQFAQATATLTLAGAALATLAACDDDNTVSADRQIADQLVPLATAARTDAAVATASAAKHPEYAKALRVVADERTVHAQRLTDEIKRLSAQAATAAAPSTTVTVSPVAVAQLRDTLSAAAKDAATLAAQQSGYRAGLLASISAACAVQVAVQLA